ncbi:hypothetical protein JCM14076_23750 [Methylosoma difficile]
MQQDTETEQSNTSTKKRVLTIEITSSGDVEEPYNALPLLNELFYFMLVKKEFYHCPTVFHGKSRIVIQTSTPFKIEY